MNKLPFILLFFLFPYSAYAGKVAPNVVIVLNESARADSFGCYGSENKTPVLDAIAAKGVYFRFVWSSMDSKTSEQMLRSGHYPFRTEVKTDSFKSLGYHSSTIEQAIKGEAKPPFLAIHILKGSSVKALDNFVEPLAKLKDTLLIISSLTGSGESNSAVSVPMVISGPPVLNPGRECWDLINITDFSPTLAEIVGRDIDRKHDGKSFLPSLQDSDDPFQKRNWIYTQSGGSWMIRDWENVLYSDGNFTRISEDNLSTEKVKKTDKIAPHRKERLEMLVNRLRDKS